MRPGLCALLRLGSLCAVLSTGGAGIASATPFGTSYLADVSNLPGDASSASLEFDGLAEAVGSSSGLLVSEQATTLGPVVLLEFSLESADGEGLVGQQLDSGAGSSVSVTGLHDFGDATPLSMVEDSAFLWLSIDGVPQAMSDLSSQGYVFGTHPLDPTLQVLFLGNPASESFSFDAAGFPLATLFGLVLDSSLVGDVDGIHLAVAAAPLPEPGALALLAVGVAGVAGLRWRPRRSRTPCDPSSSGSATHPSSPSPPWSRSPSSRPGSCSSETSRESASPASWPGGWSARRWRAG